MGGGASFDATARDTSPLATPFGEPAVLVVGRHEDAVPGLKLALERHRVYVETTDSDSVVEAVLTAAPDLILLVGDAARDSGARVLAGLGASPLSSVVPVALLDDDTALDARLRAFRHGAAAVIPRSASVDAIAAEIARLAREIPERGSESLGVVGEATLHEFVETLSKELRTGILTVTAGQGSEKDAVRLVLGSGRPLAHFIDDFVTRVRRHVVLAEPLRYEFDERAAGTVQLVAGEGAESDATYHDIRGLRLALADDDTTRADNVAQELRQHGASVVVSDLKANDARFARLRQVDPAILLIGEAHLQGDGYELVRRMRHDTRLRWAALLVVRWEEVWSDRALVPGVLHFKSTLAALAEPERAIRARAEAGESFDTRLEITGPARCLRALTGVSHPLRATFHHLRLRVEVDLSNGLVVGATGQTLEANPQKLEGPAALGALLLLSTGRVHVERIQQPASANLMATVDVALDLAEAEKVPFTPSIPVPSAPASAAPETAPFSDHRAELPRPQVEGISVSRALKLVALATLLSSLVVVALYLNKRSAAHQSPPAPATRAQVPAEAKPQAHPATEGVAAPAKGAGASAEPATPAPAFAPAEAASAPAAPADTQAEETAKSAKAADTSEAAKTAEPAPQSSDPTEEAQARLIPIHEPAKRAPTCQSLLKGLHKPEASAAHSQQELARARRELVKGNLDAAEREFCVSTELDANNVEAMTGLSRLLLLRRDGQSAVQWARKAVKARPEDVKVRALLGDALAHTGDLKSAREAWLAAAPAGATGVTSVVQQNITLGDQALDQRDAARAERYYRRAALLDTHHARAAVGLARALVMIGDRTSAISWARRARQLAPKLIDIRLLVGDVLLQAGSAAEAANEFRAAASLDPADPRAPARLRRLETAH